MPPPHLRCPLTALECQLLTVQPRGPSRVPGGVLGWTRSGRSPQACSIRLPAAPAHSATEHLGCARQCEGFEVYHRSERTKIPQQTSV